MYQQFFGFSDKVFSKSVHPDKVYFNDSYNELIKRFDYITENRGIMLLTGEPGSGKTCFIRYFISKLNKTNFFPVYIPLATVAIGDFYRQLNDALHGEPAFGKANVFKAIQSQIISYTVNRNIVPVVIFDESHLLKDQNFKELQIISNFKYDTFSPVVFILAGQSVLIDRVRSYNLVSFNQRISIKYHLPNLTLKESKKYIIHHFKICNRENNILTEPAYTAVFNVTKGIPRVIGEVVKKALMIAAGKKSNNVSEEDIIAASHEVL
jgi:type II secretory pathway predicted ATPase ExeA